MHPYNIPIPSIEVVKEEEQFDNLYSPTSTSMSIISWLENVKKESSESKYLYSPTPPYSPTYLSPPTPFSASTNKESESPDIKSSPSTPTPLTTPHNLTLPLPIPSYLEPQITVAPPHFFYREPATRLPLLPMLVEPKITIRPLNPFQRPAAARPRPQVAIAGGAGIRRYPARVVYRQHQRQYPVQQISQEWRFTRLRDDGRPFRVQKRQLFRWSNSLDRGMSNFKALVVIGLDTAYPHGKLSSCEESA
ncbi:hypothetical protein HYALB_00004984 [Hymenoscyphus albidus]|uniref:Uncharacterized protein n=1 Tax=Hymenoscyphus albidus TaxID=595503 RepID=A0A9N9Q9Z3_9HELO|nr:hypothetical protein HYALB_00004984 [Hymenoscyphus albidus]